MRHQMALGAGIAAAALALVVTPQVAGAVGSASAAASTAVCTSTDGRACPVASPGPGNVRAGMGAAGRRASVGTPAANAGRGMGPGAMAGTGTTTSTALGAGTLTSAQRTTVAAMAEEEKLAHDVYTALAARFPTDPRFARIASSESQHLAALRRVMTAYGIADPTAGLPDGTFPTAAAQQLYTELLAKATTIEAASAVGRAVETKDIADLDAAMASVTAAPDVDLVYSHLRTGSQRHLRAFGG